jgi:uncharacterized protein YdaU (DUF1376 family)
MHYFEFNIKDYRADAFQLTLIQHGAYKQLIDQYCLNESPLTLNLEDLFYDLLIRGDDEKKAIVFVLEKFFDKTENGYVHKRCDAVIKKYQAKSNQSRDAVNTRWAREKGKDTDVIREAYDRNTNQEQPTNNKKPKNIYSGKSDRFDDFWSAWPRGERKQSKADCKKKWQSKGLDEIADKIISHVEKMKLTDQWTSGFEPMPATYLNQERYLDFDEPSSQAGVPINMLRKAI